MKTQQPVVGSYDGGPRCIRQGRETPPLRGIGDYQNTNAPHARTTKGGCVRGRRKDRGQIIRGLVQGQRACPTCPPLAGAKPRGSKRSNRGESDERPVAVPPVPNAVMV